MAPALFWVLLAAGLIVSLPIGWRIGYHAGRRDYSELPAQDWNDHVDQALTVVNKQLTTLLPSELARAIESHPSNVAYLRNRRDKIE